MDVYVFFAKLLLCFVAYFSVNLYSKQIFLFFLCVGNQPFIK